MRADFCNDDLIRVRIDHEVRIVGDHYDLPFGLRGYEQRDKFVEDGLGIEVFLGLIDDERTIIGIVQSQIEKKENDASRTSPDTEPERTADMTRVALYARYSSDNQREASIEDQLRICREQAKREKWKIVGTYKDAGISGASMILRPGIQALLQDAQAGQFDIVLAEALDRISRDQADVATFYKHLKFAGVPIVTLSEGEISELHVGLKGTMNALFLKDLAAKTHRGIRGRVEDGKSGGGLCFGYNVVKQLDARGDPIRGDREINEAEANVVRRIFREFAAGVGPRTIARTLNEEGVPGPAGKLWSDTTIRGHVKRGTGLVRAC